MIALLLAVVLAAPTAAPEPRAGPPPGPSFFERAGRALRRLVEKPEPNVTEGTRAPRRATSRAP